MQNGSREIIVLFNLNAISTYEPSIGLGAINPPSSLKKKKGPTRINIITIEISHPNRHLSNNGVVSPMILLV